MHDIICPHCGEKFIACDVAFDISRYILPLLYDDPAIRDMVENAGFRYYVDQTFIENHLEPDADTPLFCDIIRGDRNWRRMKISNQDLIDYITETIDIDSELEPLLAHVSAFIPADKSKRKPFDAAEEQSLLLIYLKLFSRGTDMIKRFNAGDRRMETMLTILHYVNSNRKKEVTVQLRLYSTRMNKACKYIIPDVLTVNDHGTPDIIKKCCRYCGVRLPAEFGYYRIKPVILLGSHYSGKTSFMLAMLYATQNRPPFVTRNSSGTNLTYSTLLDDDDLKAFSKNIDNYRRGEAPEKTDFVNIPILNLRVDQTIYSFFDWPGENFINDDPQDPTSFILRSRPVIMNARHFMFFAEPCQIDTLIPEKDEHVSYHITDLLERFRLHLMDATPRYIRSITFVINKADRFLGETRDANGNVHTSANAGLIRDIFTNYREDLVCNENKWSTSVYDDIERKTCDFLDPLCPAIFRGQDLANGNKNIVISYLPVAPYGKEARRPGENAAGPNAVVDQFGLMTGLPLLRLMEIDGLLKDVDDPLPESAPPAPTMFDAPSPFDTAPVPFDLPAEPSAPAPEASDADANASRTDIFSE